MATTTHRGHHRGTAGTEAPPRRLRPRLPRRPPRRLRPQRPRQTTAPGRDRGPEETTAAPDEGGSSFVTLEQECETYDGLQAPADFSVNLVTDIGKIDDGTFNQFAYEGMNGAVECFGIANSSYIETVSEADYAANIATSLESNPNVLVTVGFLITTDTEAAAVANPDVNFIGIDQFLTEYPPNMAGVAFAENESGFIAGVLAASLSQSGVIGVVAGREDVPPVVKFVNGYTRGAESVNPDIRVLSIYNESFTDPAKGASDAAQFIGEGADVIFGAGGQTGSGGVKAAAEAGVWAIGVDQDEYFTTFAGGDAPGAEFLASSAIKRVDLVTFRLIADCDPGSVRGWSRRRDRGERPHHLRPAARRGHPGRRDGGRRGSPSRTRRRQHRDRRVRHRRPVRR